MTIGDWLRWANKELGGNKGPEAQMLLAFVVNKERALLLAHTEEELTTEQEQQFSDLIQQRKKNVPLQYLLHQANFYGRDFYVDERVLIPRFDTEILLQEALAVLPQRGTVADICTGSGILAISLSLEKQATTWAVDLSSQALEVASKNALQWKCDITLCQGDLLEPLKQEGLIDYFDVIVSNPPYITTVEMQSLDAEVLQEPHMALWGGDDGLIFYRRLAKESQAFLKQGGYLLVEIGYLQGEAVKALLEQADFADVQIIQDWQGHHRVVKGRKK